MRTKKTTILLISGKAGAGKTTSANYLIDKLRELEGINVQRYSFASPIKYMATAYFGWKEEKDEKGRKLLQDIGRIGRDYDDVIWVKHLLNQLDKLPDMFPPNFVVIDDWRFSNELSYLLKNIMLDVITMRVFGRGGLDGEASMDISENSLPEPTSEQITISSGQLYDFTVDNSGTIEQLNSKLDTVLAEIKKQYIVE